MIEYKYFKKLNRKLPSLGLGTWRLGSSGDDPIRVLRSGFDLGLTLVDTAESYAFGYSEELIGEAIKGYDRDDIFIISKVSPNRRRSEVSDAAAKSVKRLGTYIDLYLLHSPHIVEGSLRERLQGLEDVVDKGLARNIGLSNFSETQIELANQLLSKHEVVAIQNKLNLKDRYWLNTVVPYCQQHDLAFFAYTPLDTGNLAHDDKLSQYSRMYKKFNVQVALNWLMAINSVIPIVKADNNKHLLEDVGSMGWKLSKASWADILEDYCSVDGYSFLNRGIVKQNLRYYFTPRFFKKYYDYYKHPENLVKYIRGTVWKRKNHL